MAQLRSIETVMEIDYMGRGVESIDSIDISKECTILNLHNNKLTNLKGLRTLYYLTELNLSSNHFSSSDLPQLALLPALKSLDLSANLLYSVNELPFMPSVESLQVAHNFISSINGLEECVPNVQSLDLRGNQINDISEMTSIAHLKALRDIRIGGTHPNPVSEFSPNIIKLFQFSDGLLFVDGKQKNEWLESQLLSVPTPRFDKLVEHFRVLHGGNQQQQQQYHQQYDSQLNSSNNNQHSRHLYNNSTVLDQSMISGISHGYNSSHGHAYNLSALTNPWNPSVQLPIYHANPNNVAMQQPNTNFIAIHDMNNNYSGMISSNDHNTHSKHRSDLNSRYPDFTKDLPRSVSTFRINTLDGTRTITAAAVLQLVNTINNQHIKAVSMAFHYWRRVQQHQNFTDQLQQQQQQHQQHLHTIKTDFDRRLVEEQLKFESLHKKYLQLETINLNTKRDLGVLKASQVSNNVQQQQVITLQHTLHLKDNELQTVKARLEQAEVQVLTQTEQHLDQQQQQQQIKTLSETNHKLTTELATLQSELQYTKTSYTDDKEVLQRLKDALASKTDETTREQANVSNAQKMIATLESTITQLQQQQLEIKNNPTMTTLLKQLDQAEQTVVALTAQRTALTQHNAELQEQFQSLQQHHSQATKQLSSTSRTLADLQQQFSDNQANEVVANRKFEQRLVKLKEAFDTATKKASDYKVEVQELKSKLVSQQSIVKELSKCVRKFQDVQQQQLQQQQQQQQTLECSNCLQLQQEMSALTDKLSTVKAENNSMKASLQGTQHNLTTQSDEIVELQQQLKAANNLMQELTTTLKVKEAIVNDQATDLSSTKQRLQAVEKELRACHRNIDDLEMQLEQQQQRAQQQQQLAEQLDERLQAKSETEAKLKMLIADYERLDQQQALQRNERNHHDSSSHEQQLFTQLEQHKARELNLQSETLRLRHELQQQRQQFESQLQAKDFELSNLTRSLATLEQKSSELGNIIAHEKELNTQQIDKLRSHSKNLAKKYERVQQQLTLKEFELQRNKQATEQLQVAIKSFQQLAN